MSPTDGLRTLMAIISHHPVLERLFFASLEFAVLALLMGIVIRVTRIRSARLISVLWLLVLAKPIASLAIGSPFPIVQFEAPAAEADSEQRQADQRSLRSLAASDAISPEQGQTSFSYTASDPWEFSRSNSAKVNSAGGTNESDNRAVSDVVGDGQTPQLSPRLSWLSVAWFKANAARAALIVWVTGIVYFVVLAALDRIRLRRLVAAADAPSPGLSARYASIASSLGVKRLPTLLVTDDLESPALAGVLAPVILVPSWVLREQDSAKLDWSLRHELMHWKLLDPLANVVRELAQILFYFHPAAWWVGKKWEEAVELACDRAIVNNEADSQNYAEQLYQMLLEIRNHRGPLVNSGLFATRTQIGRRIAALLGSPLKSPSQLSLFAAVCVAILSAVTFTVGGAFVDGSVKHEAAVQDAASDNDRTTDAASTPKSDDAIVVNGRVLAPDGKPLAGAKIYVVRWYWNAAVKRVPLAEATSGTDGHFEISYRKSQFTVDVQRPEMWKEVTIVAIAEGYGPAWVGWGDIPRGQEAMLKLVRDDMPITGRVIDLEGRPIAGVRVKIGGLLASKDGDLGGWLAAIEAGEMPWTAYRHLSEGLPGLDPGFIPSEVTTDANGRFRIDGVGYERKLDLVFDGPTVAHSQVSVVTRQMKPMTQLLDTYFNHTKPLFGADFEFSAPPTQPIVGTVRDAATGIPLAGVSVESWIFATTRLADQRILKSKTDQNGRFRIVGMPKGKGNEIIAIPNDDQPYFMQEAIVPEGDGFEPVTVDIELHRGIWITGRITDKVTGKPVQAYLHYLPFLSNRYAQQLSAEFDRHGNVDGFQRRYETRPDGTYRFVGLPGRGIVGVECFTLPYRRGVGSDAIQGINEHGWFETWRNPVYPGKKWPNSMKEIDPPEGLESVTCDVELDPGETIRITVTDEDGKPLTGYTVDGRTDGSDRTQPSEQPTFDAINFGLNDPTRTMVIRHEQRNLGKVIRASIDGDRARAMTVALQPCATVTGRVLNPDGDPVSGAAIQAVVRPTEDFGKRLSQVTTDGNGRFRYTVVPGCDYYLAAEGAGIGHQALTNNLSVKPGQTVDLGDIRLKARD